MDDEDIVFDRASLVGDSSGLRDRMDRGKGWFTRRHIKTYCLALSFFALGLCIALPGPTLPDLQAVTETNVSQIMWIFTGRSSGYFLGSIIGGFLFERVNQLLLLCTALSVTAVATGLAPWCRYLPGLVALIAAQGLTMGFFDTGGNVMILQIWGRDGATFMHALHSAFAVGAFLAPLMATPFLAAHRLVAMEMSTTLVSMTTSADTNATTVKAFTSTLSPQLHVSSYFELAYLVVALILALSAFYSFVLWCRYDSWRLGVGKQFDHLGGAGTRSEYIVNKDRLCLRLQILIGLFMFYFFYVGMEVAYGSLISTFSIHKFNFSTARASVVASVFWGAFACGRISAIFFAHCVSPAAILCIDLAIATISLFVLAFWERLVKEAGYETVVWVGSAAVGVGMSSIFPAGLSWAERYIKITGGAASVFVIGSALGEMVIPALCGWLMDHYIPEALLYSLFIGAACALVLFSLLALSACRSGERYDIDSTSRHGGDLLERGGSTSTEDLVPLVGEGSEDEEGGMFDRKATRMGNGLAGTGRGKSSGIGNGSVRMEIERNVKSNLGIGENSLGMNENSMEIGENSLESSDTKSTVGNKNTGSTANMGAIPKVASGITKGQSGTGKLVLGKKKVTFDARTFDNEASKSAGTSRLLPKLKSSSKKD